MEMLLPETALLWLLRLHTPLAILLGFLTDLVLGDPESWYHPVRAIGALIAALERRLYPEGGADREKYRAGLVTALFVPCFSGGLCFLLLHFTYRLSFPLGFFLETVMCWQLLAVKSLKDASHKVYTALYTEGLPVARNQVARIVGRDTESLDEQGVIRAAVETVAENTSDGVTAPLLWTALGGPAAGWFYKAVNTMDSMIGYTNERYLFYGRAAAKLDDVMNYIPARVSALLMIAASGLLGFDAVSAARIWRRDRRRHRSPNSAQTESVCAGALGLQLAGDAYYFGELVKKPHIGDARREPEAEDISAANRLLFGTAFLSLLAAELVCLGLRLL